MDKELLFITVLGQDKKGIVARHLRHAVGVQRQHRGHQPRDYMSLVSHTRLGLLTQPIQGRGVGRAAGGCSSNLAADARSSGELGSLIPF